MDSAALCRQSFRTRAIRADSFDTRARAFLRRLEPRFFLASALWALRLRRSRTSSDAGKGTEVHADEAGSWNDLHGAFAMKRVNHQEAYSADGAWLRRAEIGHHHHIAGVYLSRYAQEAAWRDDHRRVSNSGQFRAVVGLVAKNKPSVDFCGYWQRSRAA